MARQPDIQYIQYYTAGSAARKLEPAKGPAKNGAKLPQMPRRVEKRRVNKIDPISVCAVAVAAIMLITMAVGMMRLGNLTDQADMMEDYAAQLSAENTDLHAEYRSGYDLKDVEQKALAMGFVPEDQLRHVSVKVQTPQIEAEPTAWQEFCLFVAGLFA